MRAGPLRHRCILQREESVEMPGAGRDVSWVPFREIWAEIGMPSGRTQPVADRLEAQVDAEIIVRFKKDITAGLRLVHKHTDETYLIEAALADNRREYLRLLCSNVLNPEINP